MAYKLLLTPQAERELKKLPHPTATRVAQTFEQMRDDPFIIAGVKKLKPPLHGFRIRTGDYRILFLIENRLIKVYAIKHRKDAYR